jgi:hypothetical protein
MFVPQGSLLNSAMKRNERSKDQKRNKQRNLKETSKKRKKQRNRKEAPKTQETAKSQRNKKRNKIAKSHSRRPRGNGPCKRNTFFAELSVTTRASQNRCQTDFFCASFFTATDVRNSRRGHSLDRYE